MTGRSSYKKNAIVTGLAACSADGDTMWQIGIDVLCKCQPEFYIVDEKTPYHVMAKSSYRAHVL